MNTLENQSDKNFNFLFELATKYTDKRANFKKIVCNVVNKHSSYIILDQVKTIPPSKGNYLVVIITIITTDKNQLNEIYTKTNNHLAVFYCL